MPRLSISLLQLDKFILRRNPGVSFCSSIFDNFENLSNDTQSSRVIPRIFGGSSEMSRSLLQPAKLRYSNSRNLLMHAGRLSKLLPDRLRVRKLDTQSRFVRKSEIDNWHPSNRRSPSWGNNNEPG
ncbi:hypothetical protein RchiOBHm_Chr4g0411811 [Rosa chinensis]|uniref:Uncharacterized protein n=1 Tax=Rosa chinensis TaxID=74649 RepID=A0A2P6QVP6_ROSCH|nr:hypothetical protein RchiOBHm_Chr4g0411811 [Rosa chinensis]